MPSLLQDISDEALNAYITEMTDKLPQSLTNEMNKMRFLQGKHKDKMKMKELLDFRKNFQLLNITGGNTLVGLRLSNRDVTRFLWLKDTTKPTVNDNVHVYHFMRIPFGVVSSAYLLGATINYHLDKNAEEVATEIKSNVYVDSVIIGSNSTQEAVKLYKEAKELFQGASMNLREWLSNSDEFNRMLPEVDRVKSQEASVLGML
ncbi:hypothetical protein HOLleu_31906 [Holothuria leucospilota]|uniref:Uncharacterized protein n=1 Tax=Holothuria leucospilota TaxID=206669 RepID=A0A9Q0YR33_HOLLE|nr:hypothetical protein HOLleu_31906 [Holothuria leucospilota]